MEKKKSKHAYPDYNFKKITDITVEDLNRMGAKAIAVDLDNTTVKDASFHLSHEVKEWVEEMRAAGFKFIIVTNTFNFRAKFLSEKMGGVPYEAEAKKPHTKALRTAAKTIGVDVSQIAMIGDQLFTDVFAANKAGAISIKVEPFEKEKLFASYWKKVRGKEKAYIRGEEVDIQGLEQNKEMNMLYKWRMERMKHREATSKSKSKKIK